MHVGPNEVFCAGTMLAEAGTILLERQGVQVRVPTGRKGFGWKLIAAYYLDQSLYKLETKRVKNVKTAATFTQGFS